MNKCSEYNKQLCKVTAVGMVINLLLGLLKIFTGIAGHSQAAVADGIHSFSDLATDLAILIGVKFWSAPPDESHPYGHGKIETLVTLFVGAALMIAGVLIAYESLSTIRDPHIERPSFLSLTGIILSIFLKEVLYRWTVTVGKRINSPSVIANAWHHRSDSFSSVLALISVTAAVFFPGLEFIDHMGAIIVAFIIAKVSWDIISTSAKDLTDAGASNDELVKIKDLAMTVNGVKEVHAVRSRRYSTGNFIDLHVLVNSRLSVGEGHDIAEKVTQVLLSKGPSVDDVVVHIEPYETEKMTADDQA